MFRRKRLSTKKLAALVAPHSLVEALTELRNIGDVEWFEIGRYRTTIKLAKTAALAGLIKEAAVPIPNPRPYIANKRSK